MWVTGAAWLTGIGLLSAAAVAELRWQEKRGPPKEQAVLQSLLKDIYVDA